MRFKLVPAVAVALMIGASSLQAQNTCATNPCTITNTASATVVDVVRLTLDGTTTDLGTPAQADYDAGYRVAAGPTATVKANRGYTVSVVANSPAFTYAGSLTDPTKTAADLKWGTVAGTYGNNAGASATLKTSSTGTSSTSQQIFYKTMWTYATDVPGTYSLVMNFTLSAP